MPPPPAVETNLIAGPSRPPVTSVGRAADSRGLRKRSARFGASSVIVTKPAGRTSLAPIGGPLG